MPRPVPATLVQKIWARHAVCELDAETSLLFIDRIFLHDRTGGRMLKGLQDKGRSVANRDLVFGTLDHVIDTDPGRTDRTKMPGGTEFIGLFRERMQAVGIPIFDLGDERQGIVHVVAPELGIALPGITFICGDSHTCTIGGVGALAWGVGISQGELALATQTLPMKRPKMMRVRCEGALGAGVSAKDLICFLIGRHTAAGASGCALEFAGAAVAALSIEARMTLCNMAVEFAAVTGIVGADDVTFQFLNGRPFAPSGADWDRAEAHWRSLATDADAVFDREIVVDCSEIAPQVTWGTSPQHVLPIEGRIPDPATEQDVNLRAGMTKALAYADLAPGTPIAGVPIEAAFIGSCTNSRIEDLRTAAAVLNGRKIAAGIKAICVPGAMQVKRQAEAEGLDRIFLAAGFEWREPGCSLCFFGNGDNFGGARRVITSTNRNFENRQGPGVRSHLASPATVAASAIAGRIADPRRAGA
jgi:3-isopropylmalate/(R)-2-methylmalate dehydratase large subunit